jgi:hypothetical protein
MQRSILLFLDSARRSIPRSPYGSLTLEFISFHQFLFVPRLLALRTSALKRSAGAAIGDTRAYVSGFHRGMVPPRMIVSNSVMISSVDEGDAGSS